jgi:hypothetical protein
MDWLLLNDREPHHAQDSRPARAASMILSWTKSHPSPGAADFRLY